MSFIPVIQYISGIGVFGFIYWLLNGILYEFIALSLQVSSDTWTLLLYIWVGILIVYLLFGGIWVVRKYTEPEYMQGVM